MAGRENVARPDAGLPPEDFLHFVELDEFGEDWKRCGLNIERDLWTLQTQIMRAPRSAPLIAGTGGLRKMRFAPPDWNRGKSGAIRVCYAYFEAHAVVLLVMAYEKVAKETLTAGEKTGIKAYLAVVAEWLDAHAKKKRKYHG